MTASTAQRALAHDLLARHPAVAAATLEKLSGAQVAETLAEQPTRVAEMSPPQAASILRWMPDERRETLLGSVGGRAERELREVIGYPVNTAGSLMDPRVYVTNGSETASEALARIAGVRKPLYQMYVVDDAHRVTGSVAIQDLATAPSDQKVSTLLSTKVETIDAFTHRDDLMEMLARTALPTLAVVDLEGHLIGVLRHRALLGIVEEGAASMAQQMVGVSPDERALSPVWFAVKKRLPWLNINLLTAFLAASVVGLFEGTIAQVTSLAVLLPGVAGQSGNSGSQALAVTMRGLALREIRAVHWPRIAAKELIVGMINGVAIAIVTGAGVWIWSSSAPLAGVIAVAMIASMSAAGLAGASVPIVLKSLGQDPAQSSSIILTTVTDVVGFSTFLGLAALLIDKLV